MHTVLSYIKSLFLLEFWRGLLVTGRQLRNPRFTVQYPEEKIPQSVRFKGLHARRRHANGEERCIACKLCEAVCPVACITIEVEVREDDARRTTRYDIDLFKCMYCGFCEEACPTDAIVLTRISEFHFEHRGGKVITKEQLVAIGDRNEARIAADRRADATFR